MSDVVTSIVELLDNIEGVDDKNRTDLKWIESRISRIIYKNTDCGACFCARVKGIALSGYVEGWDGECPSHYLGFPFKMEEFWNTLELCDQEADEIWKQTHGCDDCWDGKPMEGDLGRPVDPDCPTCGGDGIVI